MMTGYILKTVGGETDFGRIEIFNGNLKDEFELVVQIQYDHPVIFPETASRLGFSLSSFLGLTAEALKQRFLTGFIIAGVCISI